jgi:uncharacterized protein GlcG (DUF336 family)
MKGGEELEPATHCQRVADGEHSPRMDDLTAEAARAVLDAVVAEAVQLGVTSNVAVVDAGGNLKAFVRMDGALLGSVDVAMRKARTARLFEMATEELGPLTTPGAALAGLEHTNGGLVTFGGGTPLRSDGGAVIGGLGVSGSTVENDTRLAAVGAKAASS